MTGTIKYVVPKAISATYLIAPTFDAESRVSYIFSLGGSEYVSGNLRTQLQDLSRQYQQLANNQPVSSYAPQAQPIQIPVPVPARQVQYVDGLQGARLYQEKNLQPNSSEIIMDKLEK